MLRLEFITEHVASIQVPREQTLSPRSDFVTRCVPILHVKNINHEQPHKTIDLEILATGYPLSKTALN